MQQQKQSNLGRATRTAGALAVIVACLLFTFAAGHSALAAPAQRSATAGHVADAMLRDVQQARSAGDAVCAQPPVGVDRSQLSDTQLAYYGFSPRPQDTASKARWAEGLAMLRHRLCGAGVPVPGAQLGWRTGRRAAAPLSVTNQWSSSWAGSEATGYGNFGVSAYWHLPSNIVCDINNETDVAEWVGLGGDPNNGGGNLPQSGFWFTKAQSCSLTIWAVYMDCCTLDHSIHKYPNFAANLGDSVYVETYDNVYSNQSQYYIDDFTTGWYVAPSENNSLTNRSTAEVITEDPLNNGALTALANYGTASYTNAAVFNGSSWILMTPSLPILNDESCSDLQFGCHVVTQYAAAVNSSGNLSTTWNGE